MARGLQLLAEHARSISSKCGRPTRSTPQTIDRELGWAKSIGFNTVRVFLHELPWQEDREGFFKRVDEFLGDRRQAQDPAAGRALRRRVGSGSAKRPAAAPAHRRAQQRLGAKPGRVVLADDAKQDALEAVCHRRGQALRQRRPRAGVGLVQRARQRQRQQLRAAGAEEQGRSRGAARAQVVRVGPRGRADAAADRRRVARSGVGRRRAS